ncbi:Osmotin thaumatin-like protein [Hymenopellis radicata]|nr:Osmotin thaumatin-like protein [Hymenopellis radicata]
MKTFAILAALVASASAFTITFQNSCSYTVWAAIGKAPDGQVDPSLSYGVALAPGASKSYGIDDNARGIRAWGRTGCNASGANCATGACNDGLVCTDAGITSHALLSEYGYADFGIDGTINIPTTLTSSDGQSVKCTPASCPDDQAYSYATDYAADRNSPLGATYTHKFC